MAQYRTTKITAEQDNDLVDQCNLRISNGVDRSHDRDSTYWSFKMSSEINNVTPKQYAHIATRVLNRSIKKREQQIAATEAGNPTSKKTLAQLKHELDMMMNELMERTMTKSSETIVSQPEE